MALLFGWAQRMHAGKMKFAGAKQKMCGYFETIFLKKKKPH